MRRKKNCYCFFYLLLCSIKINEYVCTYIVQTIMLCYVVLSFNIFIVASQSKVFVQSNVYTNFSHFMHLFFTFAHTSIIPFTCTRFIEMVYDSYVAYYEREINFYTMLILLHFESTIYLLFLEIKRKKEEKQIYASYNTYLCVLFYVRYISIHYSFDTWWCVTNWILTT